MQLTAEPRSGLGKVGQCILPAHVAAGLKSNRAGRSWLRKIHERRAARGRLEARPTLDCIVPAEPGASMAAFLRDRSHPACGPQPERSVGGAADGCPRPVPPTDQSSRRPLTRSSALSVASLIFGTSKGPRPRETNAFPVEAVRGRGWPASMPWDIQFARWMMPAIRE